jgi:hypothetical protein
MYLCLCCTPLSALRYGRRLLCLQAVQKAKNLTQSLEYSLLFCFFCGGGEWGRMGGGGVKESLGGSCKDVGGGL